MGYGCGECPACRCALKVLKFQVEGKRERDGQHQDIQGYIFLVLFASPSRRQTGLNWPRGNGMRPEWPHSVVPVAPDHHGAFWRADDRPCARFARSGPAPAWRRVRHRRDRLSARRSRPDLRRRHLVVASAAAFLLSEFADFAVYTPLAPAASPRSLHQAGCELDRPCGSPSAHSSSWSVRSSAFLEWLSSRFPWSV